MGRMGVLTPEDASGARTKEMSLTGRQLFSRHYTYPRLDFIAEMGVELKEETLRHEENLASLPLLRQIIHDIEILTKESKEGPVLFFPAHEALKDTHRLHRPAEDIEVVPEMDIALFSYRSRNLSSSPPLHHNDQTLHESLELSGELGLGLPYALRDQLQFAGRFGIQRIEPIRLTNLFLPEHNSVIAEFHSGDESRFTIFDL